MNLMITNYCNLHCNYCFAQEEMNSKSAQAITMENFIKYLNFLKREIELGDASFQEVRLIGGEPSLHPHLEQLIDKIIEYKCFRSILIFSNITFDHSIAEMLVRKSRFIEIGILANVNYLDYLLPKQRENILNNLDYLTTNLPGFSRYSLNIYSPDQDLSMWEDLACRYNIHSIRWSIVVPNKKLEKDFDVKDYFHQFQPLLLKLAQFTKNYGIKLDCDCSTVPLCALDNDAIVELIKIDPEILYRKTCDYPVFDVAPDLVVRGCFGCQGMQKKSLLDFESFGEIVDFFMDDRYQLAKKLARKECLGCSRFQTLDQSCTCLGYRLIEREG